MVVYSLQTSSRFWLPLQGGNALRSKTKILSERPDTGNMGGALSRSPEDASMDGPMMARDVD